MFEPGWKASVLGFAAMAVTVSIINIVPLVYVSTKRDAFSLDSVVFTEGTGKAECKHIQRINTGMHLLTNVFSTVLLAGSSYCMQCNSAPTRSIIDHEHTQGRWLDIGVPSWRNLRSVPRVRLVLWITLCLSSVSLHLLYNSIIFTSTALNDYVVDSVTKGTVEPVSAGMYEYDIFDITSLILSSVVNGVMEAAVYDTNGGPLSGNKSAADLLTDLQHEALIGDWANLTVPECILAYTQPFQGFYRHVFLVSDADTSRPPSLNHSSEHIPIYSFTGIFDYCGQDPGLLWPCFDNGTHAVLSNDSSHCGYNCEAAIDATHFGGANSATWAPFGQKVHHCLAQPTEPQCDLRLQPIIVAVIVALNVVKAVTMTSTLWVAFDAESALLTIGDAIAIFLPEADPHSREVCLANRSDFVLRKRNDAHVVGPRRLGSEKRGGVIAPVSENGLRISYSVLVGSPRLQGASMADSNTWRATRTLPPSGIYDSAPPVAVP